MKNSDDFMKEKSPVERLAMQIADLAESAGCYLLGEVNDGHGHGCMSFHGMSEDIELDMMTGFGNLTAALFYELQKRGMKKIEAAALILTVVKFIVEGSEDHYKVESRWGSGVEI